MLNIEVIIPPTRYYHVLLWIRGMSQALALIWVGRLDPLPGMASREINLMEAPRPFVKRFVPALEVLWMLLHFGVY